MHDAETEVEIDLIEEGISSDRIVTGSRSRKLTPDDRQDEDSDYEPSSDEDEYEDGNGTETESDSERIEEVSRAYAMPIPKIPMTKMKSTSPLVCGLLNHVADITAFSRTQDRSTEKN